MNAWIHGFCRLRIRWEIRIQPVVATPACWSNSSCSLNTSAGVLQPSVLRGRELRAWATASISSADHLERSVPFGKYCRRSPLTLLCQAAS
jgi:hypothetical protein